MVRHEAAEALGSIADSACLQLLTDFCQDPEPIVADSCLVRHLHATMQCTQGLLTAAPTCCALLGCTTAADHFAAMGITAEVACKMN